MHYQLRELPKTFISLKQSLGGFEDNLVSVKGGIIDPYSGALPPKVFENNVVINPVDAEYTGAFRSQKRQAMKFS